MHAQIRRLFGPFSKIYHRKRSVSYYIKLIILSGNSSHEMLYILAFKDH